MKRVKTTLLLVLVLIMSIPITGCGSKVKKVDLADYVTVEFDGITSAGKATVHVDYDGICEAVGGVQFIQDTCAELALNKKYVQLENGSLYTFSDIEHIYDFVIDKSSGLTEGDTVTISAVPLNPYNGVSTNEALYNALNIEFTDAKLVVKGLMQEMVISAIDWNSFAKGFEKTLLALDSWKGQYTVNGVYEAAPSAGYTYQGTDPVYMVKVSYNINGANNSKLYYVISKVYGSEISGRYTVGLIDMSLFVDNKTGKTVKEMLEKAFVAKSQWEIYDNAFTLTPLWER